MYIVCGFAAITSINNSGIIGIFQCNIESETSYHNDDMILLSRTFMTTRMRVWPCMCLCLSARLCASVLVCST